MTASEQVGSKCLALPEALVLPDRNTHVADQCIRVNAMWWTTRLAELGLPGGPLPVADSAVPALTRAEVWALADDATATEDGALRLLWSSMAWGLGRRVRLCRKRTQSIRDYADAGRLLREAAIAARTDPVAAYELLHRGGAGVFPYIGPAFGTKFLYFAGGGSPEHPSFILDQRCAQALRGLRWGTLRDGGWSSSTYGEYCTLLRRWAVKLSTDEAPAAGDQVERWLFDQG